MHLAFRVSAVLAIGTCVGAVLVWYLRKGKTRDFVRESSSVVRAMNFSRGAVVVERREPKLGLSFRYNPAEVTFKGEVRTFPVAAFEMVLALEDTSRLLVTVEECDADITLDAYKNYSLRDVMAQLAGVAMLKDKGATLGGYPAVEFEYTHKDPRGERHVWCVVSVVKRRAYCVHYTGLTTNFRCLRTAMELAKTVSITPSAPGDSFLFFTEPRYGLGMRLPVSHHIDITTPVLDRGVIARFLALHDTTRGGDMLDKSFMELRVLHDVPVRPNPDVMLETAVGALRRIIEESVADGEVLQWKGGAGSSTPRTATSFLRRSTPDNVFHVHNFVLKRTNAPGRYVFYDVSCRHGENVPEDTPPIIIQYVAFLYVCASDAFVLTAWCEEEHFAGVVANAKECFHTLCFGNQYGQEDSLLYCNPSYRFSIRVPSQLQVHEPPIGDPLVMFTPANSDATVEDITSTWVSVDAADTDSTPTMSSVPIVVDPATPYDFTVHIRVQDVGNPALRLADIASEFVADLRTAQRMEIEEERVTALDGVAAKEVVFTQSRDDGAMVKCWTVILLHGGKQYAIQLATTVEQFRQWRKVFRGMLSSFRLHTVDMR